MDAHTEHQKDHADLGQLGGDVRIGHETRGERADQHAGEEIPDDRRQAKATGDESAHEGER